MRIVDRHLHGEAPPPLFARKGFTLLGAPRKRGEYHRHQQSDTALLPRRHPARIRQAHRLRQIRKIVTEIYGSARQWPSCQPRGAYKPRKAS